MGPAHTDGFGKMGYCGGRLTPRLNRVTEIARAPATRVILSRRSAARDCAMLRSHRHGRGNVQSHSGECLRFRSSGDDIGPRDRMEEKVYGDGRSLAGGAQATDWHYLNIDIR